MSEFSGRWWLPGKSSSCEARVVQKLNPLCRVPGGGDRHHHHHQLFTFVDLIAFSSLSSRSRKTPRLLGDLTRGLNEEIPSAPEKVWGCESSSRGLP